MSDIGTQECTLQEEDESGCYKKVEAAVCEIDGDIVLILTQPGYSNYSLQLTREGWETLVAMYARRYPVAAQRIVTQAQGWITKE